MEILGKESRLRVALVHLKSGVEAISGGAFKLTFSALLIAAALGTTYVGSDINFPEIELRSVLARGMAVSGILLLGALAISLRSRTLGNAALALITFAGIFTAYVVHTELFYAENRLWLIALCPAALFGLFTAYRIMDDFRWGGLALSVAASLPVAAHIGRKVWPMLKPGLSTPGGFLDPGSVAMWVGIIGICAGSTLALYLMYRIVHPSRWGAFALLAVASFLAASLIYLGHNYGEGGSGYYANGWEDHPNVRSVAFEETPNIYFLGFDSITPEAIMSKYMGIETTDFHRVLDEEMRRFRNLFAHGVRTVYSFNTLMALDLDIFLEHRRVNGSIPSYVAGHDLSPLVWLLRQNGYETTSIYENTRFGYRQGPGIDRYIVKKMVLVCPLLDQATRPWAFWGYCWNNEEILDQEPLLSSWDFLFREMTEIDRSKPQFVVAHRYLPGHFDSSYDRDTFPEAYRKNFNRAADHLEQVIERLKANDPDSILFVFGDHGALLSDGMAVEDDPEFFIQDRFGVLGGVWPPDRCASEFDEAQSKGYMTSLDVVHAILECLSGGESPLIEPRRDRFWGGGIPEDHSYDYKEFLYE